ncbi:MAG: hypothetical protein JXB50_14945 [Spirochaetes bacterium]|nr:hypothetical protein [Spirochaetota bacterium]
MKNLILIIIMTVMVFSLFPAEKENGKKKEVYEAVGMIKFRSISSVTDEANVIIRVDQEDFFSTLNPDFLFLFSRTKDDLIDFTAYYKNNRAFESFLSLGITFDIDALIFIIPIPIVIFFADFLILVTIFSVIGGLFLLASIPFYPIAGYYYKMGKKKLKEMIDKYNENLNKTSFDLKDNKIDFNLFCFNF